MGAAVKIEHVDRLGVLLQKPKRIKILVGGRASTKSTFVADHCIAQIAQGKRWCCAREYQNSVDDSVHALLKDEIDRLEFGGFNVLRNAIHHASGGEAFYRGLARNITSLKGLHCDVLWMEEGETTSTDTLRVVTASIRATAKDQADAAREGREVKVPEIWITMNRGSSKDPISKKYLKRAEHDLERCGYYEDDLVMIIEVNYDENPWFDGSGLEQERADDKLYLSTAAYDHKWHGAYSDTVENAIIEADWFDACVDAHIKLGFKPEGMEVISHDPFDGGNDAAGLVYRHGSVIMAASESREGRVNDACDWALDLVHDIKPDYFIWDAGGVGAGLKRQITDSLHGKNINIQSFEGQSSVANPEQVYDPTVGMVMKAKKNREAFLNRRAQRYWNLRDRCFKTWLAVTQTEKHGYIDPGELISFSSEIKCLPIMRSEICRIPRIPNDTGKIQIMRKDEMFKEGIESPNIADCVMMSLDAEFIPQKKKRIPQQTAKNAYARNR